MRKQFRCKKCGYNFLAVVPDQPVPEGNPKPAPIHCPRCNAPQEAGKV